MLLLAVTWAKKSSMEKEPSCTIIKGHRYAVRSIRITPDVNLNVVIPKYCNGFLVENTGAVRAFANQKPILPPPAPGLSGESWGPYGNPGDIFVGDLIISFDPGAGAEVWISFYIYIPD